MGILATPKSPPPRPPTARRKTLAGVKISNKGGLSLQKIKRAGSQAALPAAKAAEKLVCRSLGIIRDGEDVTEATLADFTAKIKEQLAPELIMAMRDFFHLDYSAVNSVEDALIDHGGEGALEMTQDVGAAQPSLGSQ
ncbi:hypothetical protein VPH35_136903 [Triticum aestivum]